MIKKLSLNESVEAMIDSLSNSLRQSLKREGKVWISLTGGLDSRTLAAIAQYSNLPFKAYCHGPSDSRDVRIAEKISQTMGWEYEYFPLPEDWGMQRTTWFDRALGQTDGLLDVIKMSRTIREQAIKTQQLGVSLWGYGGELYRGVYWKHVFWRAGNNSTVDYERLMDYRVIPSDWSILKDGEHWKGLLRSEVRNRLQRIGEIQPEWPNTTKLDWIGQALERHACGLTIAAVLGQQRVILPFDYKENISRVFSLNYKWCAHSRLFRLILQRINPQLADMETADGSPASPMRINNLPRFVPYWLDNGKKLMWRLSNKAFGKPLWSMRKAGPTGREYPIGRWLQETIFQLRDQGILVPGQMHSIDLYDRNRLQALLTMPSNYGEGLIGRIIALEQVFCKSEWMSSNLNNSLLNFNFHESIK